MQSYIDQVYNFMCIIAIQIMRIIGFIFFSLMLSMLSSCSTTIYQPLEAPIILLVMCSV